ncbi:MAG TPA: FAD-binding protein [Bacteriovoracaceae bacterium]|nr:FAD-binding protein [Bacteriovoracaceae bacterium]
MNLLDSVGSIADCELLLGQDLTAYTTIRLVSRGDLLIVRSVEALEKILPLLTAHGREYLLVGWGANQILPPVCDKLVINLKFPFEQTYLDMHKTEYVLPASLGINHLTAHAIKFGLSGWEVFTGIPASLGGAIYMNAGTNLGEIGGLVKSVSVVTAEGSRREVSIGEGSFSYRRNNFLNPGDVIVAATLVHRGVDPEISKKIMDYLEYRKKTQPLATKNCGCVFKNPLPELQAGRLIDSLGLKGLTVGNVRVSPRHANFVEHLGGSSWDDLNTLIKIIKFQMDHFYGIEFELEVKIPYD